MVLAMSTSIATCHWCEAKTYNQLSETCPACKEELYPVVQVIPDGWAINKDGVLFNADGNPVLTVHKR